jgi:hypothetical protein
MKKTKLLQILLVGILLAGAACSDIDDTPIDPVNTVTLNMLDEENGKTMLGESDVFINKANNFQSQSCFIADIGNVGGVGTKIPPKLDNLAREVAVCQGQMYQVYDGETLRTFPSGVRAIMAGAAYYHLFVVSQILVDTKSIGAIVKYVSVYPKTENLPE